MRFDKVLLTLFLLAFTTAGFAQRIVYSQPGNDDTRRMNFEVIGKVSGNFLIYKNSRGKSFLSVYDNEMKEVSKVEQEYIPEDRLINVDFFPYNDFSYIIYQYQKKNVVYCNAAKVDGNGKRISEVITLDTSHIGFASNNKIYSTISSENKGKLMVFKINSKNKSKFVITTLLFDNELALQKRSTFVMPMEENNDYLDEFNLDNDGDLVFTKFNRNSNETINNTVLLWKQALVDTVASIPVPQDKILLDELHIKVDNANKRYFLTSFYYVKKRGNIEGFYFYVWDKQTGKPVLQNAVPLGDEIRNEAKGDANLKMAFNDYFVRNVVIKKDGGFIINTESYYTTSRSSNWNRWNYLYGSPFSSYDYYTTYSPLYNSWYWRDRYNSYQNVRRHADNVTILSFDNTGKLQWSGVIHKEQYDDESDDRISYLMANTGSQIHYLFNMDERRALLLNDYTLSPDGQLNHNPTLKNLDRGYEFLPKYGKQVSGYQLIIPCYYRNYICFAKIEFNQ
ncbi:MAG TPA: hypothetical protein VEV15_05500 [Flavisolibacter sp.]|nr:hypothetical protein [Flavisolibacter sp.]